MAKLIGVRHGGQRLLATHVFALALALALADATRRRPLRRRSRGPRSDLRRLDASKRAVS
jgi:hypothetical protein